MLLVGLLASSFDAAEYDERLAAGFLWGEARGYVGVGGLLNVEGEFFVQLGGLAGSEKKTEVGEGFTNHAEVSGTCLMTVAIAVLSRSQVASSVLSCFLPVLVRE
jgi:hypothetical protein